MTTWTNADGLKVRFGNTLTENGLAGSPKTFGESSVAVGILDADRLPANGSDVLLGNMPTVFIPAGAVIEKVEVKVDTAFAGATATLNVGLVEEDETEIDYDGLVDAEAVANLTEGATVTGSGALIGTKLSAAGYLSVGVGTADFTAGKGKVEVTYRITA